jgi:hypothetical protein
MFRSDSQGGLFSFRNVTGAERYTPPLGRADDTMQAENKPFNISAQLQAQILGFPRVVIGFFAPLAPKSNDPPAIFRIPWVTVRVSSKICPFLTFGSSCRARRLCAPPQSPNSRSHAGRFSSKHLDAAEVKSTYFALQQLRNCRFLTIGRLYNSLWVLYTLASLDAVQRLTTKCNSSCAP